MIAVIGDIHGCYYTVRELVEKIRNRFPEAELYSVGDLVDRGLNSFEVINFVKEENIKFTAGNHDYMFLYFMRYPSTVISRAWLHNGYETTVASYQTRKEKIDEHLDFISSAPLFYNLEEVFISHAGISQNYSRSLPEDFRENDDKLNKAFRKDLADEEGILWTRSELLDLGKLQIVGHTRRSEVYLSGYNNALYVDTSVYTGNKLSAAILDREKIVDFISVKTKTEDLY